MKSMKSVKAFLFCVAAVLTVAFAVAVSKPYNKVSTGSDSAADKTYDVNTGLTEDIAIPYESMDIGEEEQSESEEDTVVSVTENESNTAFSAKEDVATTQAKPSAAQSQEPTTIKPVTTVPRETSTKKPSDPVKTPSDDPEQMTVYYTKTGKRYHYKNPCGRGTFYKTTLAEAKKMGLTPCQKCVLH